MHASGHSRKTPPPASPDPLIASTLALLSTCARTQQLGAAQKIARNLALLAQHPGVSPPLRTVCSRLFNAVVSPSSARASPCTRNRR